MCHPIRINRINQKAVFQTIFQPQFFQVAILVPARVFCRHHNFKTTKPNCVNYTCRICDSISSAKSHPIPTFFLRPFKAICVITFHRWFDVEKKTRTPPVPPPLRKLQRRQVVFNNVDPKKQTKREGQESVIFRCLENRTIFLIRPQNGLSKNTATGLRS